MWRIPDTFSSLLRQFSPFVFKFPKLIESSYQRSVVLYQTVLFQASAFAGVVGFIVGDIIIVLAVFQNHGINESWGVIANTMVITCFSVLLTVVTSIGYFKKFGRLYRFLHIPIVHNSLILLQIIPSLICTGNRRIFDGGPIRFLLMMSMMYFFYPGMNGWFAILSSIFAIIWGLVVDVYYVDWGVMNLLQNLFDVLLCSAAMWVIGFVLKLGTRTKYFSNRILKMQEEKIIESKERMDALLLNILPRPIFEEFKSGDKRINVLRTRDNVVFAFIKIANYFTLTKSLSAMKSIRILNNVFTDLDSRLLSNRELFYRIKTIGNKMLLSAGLFVDDPKCLQKLMALLLEVLEDKHPSIEYKIGVNRGNTLYGVIGTEEMPSSFDVFSDSVNVCSRCMDLGEVNSIHCTLDVFETLGDDYVSEELNVRVEHGEVDMKGKGIVKTVNISPVENVSVFRDSFSMAGSEDIARSRSLEDESGIVSRCQSQANFSNNFIKVFNPLSRMRTEEEKEAEVFTRRHMSKMIKKKDKLLIHTVSAVAQENVKLKLNFFTHLYSSRHLNRYYHSEFFKKYRWENRILFLTCSILFLLFYYHDLFIFFNLHIGSVFDIFLYRFIISLPVILILNAVIMSPLYSLSYVLFEAISIVNLIMLGALIVVVVFFQMREFFSEMLSGGEELKGNPNAYFTSSYLFLFFVSCFNIHIFSKYFVFVVFLVLNFVLAAISTSVLNALTNVYMIVYVLMALALAFVVSYNNRTLLLNQIKGKWRNDELLQEEKKTRNLAYSYFPKFIYDRLMSENVGITDSAKFYDEVCIMYCDIVSFTSWSSSVSLDELMQTLNDIHIAFKANSQKFGVTVVKQIGDAFNCVAGIDKTQTSQSEKTLIPYQKRMLLFCGNINKYLANEYPHISLRIGIHYGEVVGGILGGYIKFSFDVLSKYDDSVAQVLEETGVPRRLHVSAEMYKQIKNDFEFEKREQLVNHPALTGPIQTYLVKL